MPRVRENPYSPTPEGQRFIRLFEERGVPEADIKRVLMEKLKLSGLPDYENRYRNARDLIFGIRPNQRSLVREDIHRVLRLIDTPYAFSLLYDFCKHNRRYIEDLQHLVGEYWLLVPRRETPPGEDARYTIRHYGFCITESGGVYGFTMLEAEGKRSWEGYVLASNLCIVCIGVDLPRKCEVTTYYLWHDAVATDTKLYGLEVFYSPDDAERAKPTEFVARSVVLVRRSDQVDAYILNGTYTEDEELASRLFLTDEKTGRRTGARAVAVKQHHERDIMR